MPTTVYFSWLNVTDTSTSVAQYIEQAFPEHAADYDLEAIERDFRAEIDKVLPEGVSLHGDEFHGPANVEAPAKEDIALTIQEIDFWVIAERHKKS